MDSRTDQLLFNMASDAVLESGSALSLWDWGFFNCFIGNDYDFNHNYSNEWLGDGIRFYSNSYGAGYGSGDGYYGYFFNYGHNY